MTVKKTDKKSIEPDRDELASLIAESLNKMNKDSDQVAFFLDGRESTPTDFTDFISTGATMLDVAISNRANGGIAVGRITELTGLEGSGKSLIGAQLIANTQRRGGVGVLIDTETAVNAEFFKAVGIDMNKLVYVQLQTVEEIFDAITTVIEKVRTGKDKNKLVTIVVDSVAAASTKKEMEADFGKDGYATDKAIIISKAMRKITGLLGRERIALVFTNQLRQKMNAMAFSDPWCVDPLTTKVKIRYKLPYVEEEVTLAELADRFLSLNDFETPEIYDMDSMGIEVETIDPVTGDKVFRAIKNFVVKNTVSTHYTDGVIKGTANHRVIENGKEVRLEEHSEFRMVEEQINVVDIEVEEFASYLANGRLHHNTTSGGKAIAFHASTRLRLSLMGKISNSAGDVIGVKVKANVVKNRLGPPHRTAEFEIYFNRGIDDVGAWLSVMKENKMVKQGGAWYVYTDPTTGEETKFQSKEFSAFLEANVERKERIYAEICESLIMRYQSEFDPENVSIMGATEDE